MMQLRIQTFSRQTFMMAGALLFVLMVSPYLAKSQDGHSNGDFRSHDRPHLKIRSFSVSGDQTLTYPSNLTNLPDEHTTIIPLHERHDFSWGRGTDTDTYLIFASSGLTGGNGGTVVLETTDLQNFTFATDRGYAEQVMNPPVDFHACDPAFHDVFDENYSAPGSVLQDPRLPPGNLIMFYEAENHCPGDQNQHFFYATVGFARSSDGGRTWPQPVDAVFGGPDRHPVLKSSIPEPQTNFNGGMGDAIPSAFMDRHHVYVTYGYHEAGKQGSQNIRVARASLDDDDHGFRDEDWFGRNSDQLQFFKWNNGSFSEPGIGGVDSPVVPSGGCLDSQAMPEITYNDELGLYIMVFVCNHALSVSGDLTDSWFYSTATSLDLQDWTPPQMILGSSRTVITPCNLKENTGTNFDGFYPSFMSPGSPAGHTRLTGKVFFLSGCDTGQPRTFTSRTFTITTEPE